MPRDNRLPTYESLLEFQEVVLRAVALAWTDPEFKDALLTDTHAAFENYLGYVCPWNLNLEFKAALEPTYGWRAHKGEWELPRLGMTFGVPAKPARVEEQVVALAAYNDAGPTYLFTCC